jgi:DNA-binding CsgD family transcriptional regulator/tetratricopeptide (TPR) repeat protein
MPPGTAISALVGRAAELQALRSAKTDTDAGGVRTVVIGGEAGIGKTRLITEFVDSVSEDTIVLWGRCVDLGSDAPPYAPVAEALRELVQAVGTAAVMESVGAALPGLRVVLPELPADELPSNEEAAARTRGSLVFDAVTVAFESASNEHPLVLVIDDLHWADQATLSLLRFLVRVASRGRLLIVLGYRSDDVGRGHPLRSWLAELDRDDRVERHLLPRLERPQIRELASAIRGSALDSRALDVLADQSAGVPFYVEEIVVAGAVENSVPDSLRDLLLVRYEALSEPTQRLVRVLSAGGLRVEHDVLEAVYDRDPDEIEPAIREAMSNGVLTSTSTGYEFRHGLVRDSIHDELLPSERVRVHTHYALALSAGGSVTASEVSYHWMAAHDAQKAFAASIVAMQHAASSFAYQAAAQMGERALELWCQVDDAQQIAGRSRTSLLAATAHFHRDTGASDRALALVDEALASDEPVLEATERARLLRDKASYLANIGAEGSITLLREALVVLEGTPASVLRAYVLGELAARLMLDARFDDAITTAEQTRDEALAAGSRSRMSVAANIRGVSLMHNGMIEAGLSELRRAGELADEDDSPRLRYSINYSGALALLGRYSEAIDAAEAGAERARERGVERTTGAMLIANTIDPLYSLGEWDRAELLLDQALDLSSPLGYSAHLQRYKLWATLWRGDVSGASDLLRAWRGALRRQVRTDVWSRLDLAKVCGEIALEHGRTVDAWNEASGVLGAHHRGMPSHDLPLLWILARVIGSARQSQLTLPDPDGGDPMEFADAAARVRARLAAMAWWPTAPIYAGLVEAELSCAVSSWRESVRLAESRLSPAHLLSYTTARLAAALALEGSRDEARRVAVEARAAAEAVGVGLVVAHIDDLERRLGGAVDGAHGIPVLTEREQQVLDLVARGLSNKDIADELFISAKTASVHVSNILRKLGATSRTEAAFRAAELRRTSR